MNQRTPPLLGTYKLNMPAHCTAAPCMHACVSDQFESSHTATTLLNRRFIYPRISLALFARVARRVRRYLSHSLQSTITAPSRGRAYTQIDGRQARAHVDLRWVYMTCHFFFSPESGVTLMKSCDTEKRR
jgi:hypothetical protein